LPPDANPTPSALHSRRQLVRLLAAQLLPHSEESPSSAEGAVSVIASSQGCPLPRSAGHYSTSPPPPLQLPAPQLAACMELLVSGVRAEVDGLPGVTASAACAAADALESAAAALAGVPSPAAAAAAGLRLPQDTGMLALALSLLRCCTTGGAAGQAVVQPGPSGAGLLRSISVGYCQMERGSHKPWGSQAIALPPKEQHEMAWLHGVDMEGVEDAGLAPAAARLAPGWEWEPGAPSRLVSELVAQPLLRLLASLLRDRRRQLLLLLGSQVRSDARHQACMHGRPGNSCVAHDLSGCHCMEAVLLRVRAAVAHATFNVGWHFLVMLVWVGCE
jgi:hypothetical protein